MEKKRIAVLSLSTGKPRLMLAGVDKGNLFIVQCDSLEPSMLQLKLTLPEKLQDLKKRGFILVVDEVLPYFGRYGRTVSLSDLDSQGRPIIVSAMQAYNNLKSLSAIRFPKDAGGRFEVSPSIVEEVRGTDGKQVYNIDWSELSPEVYTLMLTIHVATQESLLDPSSLKSFFKNIGAANKKPKLEDGMFGLFRARDSMIANFKRAGEQD